MSINFEDANVKKYMFDGNFGLEKESLRVDSSGFLSLTGHPFPANQLLPPFIYNNLTVFPPSTQRYTKQKHKTKNSSKIVDNCIFYPYNRINN
ncbi:MAG: hypothetical protein ACI4F6_06680 [Acutalibacteraceae bacterium]